MSQKFGKEPVRILQIVTSMNRAGLETMLMNFYRKVDRSRVQFDFVVHRHEKGAYDDEILELGGRIYRMDPIGSKSMLTYRKKFKSFLKEHPEYKIVHAHLDALSALPLSAARDCGVPTRIAHSHNSNFDFDLKYFIRQFHKRRIVRYANSLVACSDNAGRFMFGKTAKFSLIHNAIDMNKYAFNPEKREEYRSLLDVEGDYVIGHVGRFVRQKNHAFLIQVFEQLLEKCSNAKLVLVGEGDLESLIRDTVGERGIEDRVIFMGSRPDVSELMQAFDVFVLPSLYEGLPVVAVEAQASGLPALVGSNVSRECELTDDIGFVDLELEKWVEEISARSELIRGAMKQGAMAQYDIEKECERLLAFYGV